MSINIIKSFIYEILSYFVPQKQKYTITGKCNKCGKCCKEIHSFGMKNENDLKFMQRIFPWYNFFYISGFDENGNIILSCKKLNDNGQCSIYKFRPLLCRNYPKKYINFSTDMIEGCGYQIIKKNFKDYL